jgi:hypothetical protein
MGIKNHHGNTLIARTRTGFFVAHPRNLLVASD